MTCSRRLLLFAACTALLQSGCAACWTDTEYVDQLVWADDDSQIAGVMLRFQERQIDPLSGTSEKMEFRHQLFVAGADGNDLTLLGDERGTQNAAEIYFMATAGYILSSSLSDENALLWHRTSTRDGQSTPVPIGALLNDITPTETVFVLPAPDAQALAIIQVSNDIARVAFADAQSFASIGTQFDIPMSGPPSWTFRADGVLVIADNDNAFALDRNATDALITEIPECIFPQTSSSQTDSDGRFLSTDEDSNIIISGPGEWPAFGECA